MLTPERPLDLPPAADISSGMNTKVSSKPNHSTLDQRMLPECSFQSKYNSKLFEVFDFYTFITPHPVFPPSDNSKKAPLTAGKPLCSSRNKK